MFDSLSQMMQQQGGQQQQPMQQQQRQQPLIQHDAMSYAAMLILGGAKPQDAYVQGAKMARDEEHSQLERQKQESKQQQLAVASKILQEGGSLADLLAAGVDNPAILGALPQSQWVPNRGNPEGGEWKNPGTRGMQTQGGGGRGMSGPQNNMSPFQEGPYQSPQQNTSNVPSQQNMAPRYDQFDNSELGIKAANQIKVGRIQQADEYVRKINDQARNARATVHTARQLETLIPKIFSGQGLDPETKETWSKRLNINPEEVTAGQIFTSEVSNIIGEIERQVKDGRATDAAAQIIIDAKPKIGYSEEANFSLVRGIIARGLAMDERAEALTKWKQQGRDPNAFEETWAAYERKNPLLSLDKKGQIKVNDANISKWRKAIFGEEIGEVSTSHGESEESNNNDQDLLNSNFEKLKSMLAK